MSKTFIEGKYGSQSLDKARRQYQQLSYFLTSDIQEDVRVDYFENFVKHQYYTNDVFLNWVKSIFKDKNFLSFVKYFRNPNPASELINTRVKEPLSRVFFSEDSYFNYIINGQKVAHPGELNDDFEERLFNAIVFNYNDVIIHDLFDINKPYREFVSIDKVVSIKMKHNEIQKIAYSAKIDIEGEEILGYAYVDDVNYQFYSKDCTLLKSEPHDLGSCPATFVVKDCFDNDEIVKKSMFSYLRSNLEEYSFLKTLQRMANANGTIPITVKLNTVEKSETGKEFDAIDGEPMSVSQLGSKVSAEARTTAGNNSGSVMQAGSEIGAPVVEKDNGSIDMEVVKNFVHFYYTPVEALEFLNKRITELENKIITSSLGDYSEGNEASMTELQVSKGFVSREDKLRWVSNTLSYSRQLSDYVMLSLAYGKQNVKVDIFYGSDFFQESQRTLYELFEISPNAIERKNILIRLSQRRNMFNKEKSEREVILYKLLPYCADKDFQLAITQNAVDPIIFQFQTKFDYWIQLFEATYGSIVVFWATTKATESEKIILITNLIKDLIEVNTNLNTNNNGGKETDN
jgi:hypothetical protein